MQVSTKPPALVGIPTAQLAVWWPADKPDCQAEVAAQKAEHTREGLDEPRNQNSKL